MLAFAAAAYRGAPSLQLGVRHHGQIRIGLASGRAGHRARAAVHLLSLKLKDAAINTPADPQDLLDAQRKAHRNQPDSFKEDALTDKVVSVEPDGTGPTPTETFDTDKDQRKGSGGGPA